MDNVGRNNESKRKASKVLSLKATKFPSMRMINLAAFLYIFAFSNKIFLFSSLFSLSFLCGKFSVQMCCPKIDSTIH
jgi:hypothetical protein